jgi:hypothetical protein
MKSTGDPILDLQALVTEEPKTKAQLEEGYKAFGWGVPFETVFKSAEGIFFVKTDDGFYVRREGTVREVAAREMSRAKGN